MKVRMDGNNPTQFWVSSESEGEVEYCVNLVEYPIGTDEYGNMLFNGACGLTNERIHGCRDFIFRCEPKLKNPENISKVFRCKHCRAARDHALDLLLPYLARCNPNIPDEQQT